MNELRVPGNFIVIWGGGVSVVCGLDGSLNADDQHGFFAADTRLLSSYRLSIDGQAWQLLGRWQEGHGTARWEFQNESIRTASGEVEEGQLQLSLRRRVDRALHDDLLVRSFAPHAVRTRLVLAIDGDFSDIFEVKAEELPPRLAVHREPSDHNVRLRYSHEDFRRGLEISFQTEARITHVGALVVFDLDLSPGGEWRCCIDARPELGGAVYSFNGDPHAPERPVVTPESVTLEGPAILARAFEAGRRDLRSLAIEDHGATYVAAGVPWFQTVFGRDQLVAALMCGIDGVWAARGALAVLGSLQAHLDDAWRDAEPGKIAHELRSGELAELGLIPHSPYYGTHDAACLYVLTLWNAWRWSGDKALLDAHLDTARRALDWAERYGDRDDDGLQEYATQSRSGYYNQGWKDAGDAIVHADGSIAPLPIATVELQGYLFAARLGLAEILEARGERAESEHLRHLAVDIRNRVEERCWLEFEECYALGLDGRKRLIASVASNQGHLLWCGLPRPDRARLVATRLLKTDMASGWGLRTLSSEHPAYNPLSYQSGSVWPHDTLIAAAGLMRYGLREEAWSLIHAILEAAGAFADDRLPEVFCGLERSEALPVPYRQANRPQAWAAAAPLLAAQLLLGIVPDGPHRRCYVAPELPEWLPELAVTGLSVANGTVSVRARRTADGTRIEEARGDGIDVIVGTPPAVLWGTSVLDEKSER